MTALSVTLLGCTHNRPPAESAPAEPETFEFEQGLDQYDGFEDTTIFSESEFSGGASRGLFSGTILNLEFDGSRQHRRALIRADLTSIPADWTIEDVSLRLTVRSSGGNFGDINYALHRVDASWGEGNVTGLSEGGFGAPAETGDATWISRQHDQSLWNTPGGDFATPASAIAAAGRMDISSTWNSQSLIGDVQAWVSDPQSNNGWIIIGELEGTRQRVKRFYSSESDINRPNLVIVARPPDAVPRSNSQLLIKAVEFMRVVFGEIKERFNS